MKASKAKEESAAYGRGTARSRARRSSAVMSEDRVVLRNVSWDTFERLLSETGEHRNTRFSYDNGTLEIMSPYRKHEGANRLIELLVYVIADELAIACESLGSLTCKHKETLKGIEPDSCFFIQNAEKILGKDDYDASQDPPPDLMLEIDISASSISKLNICAVLAVPEVWLYNGETLRIHCLENGAYVECEESRVLPFKRLRSVIPEFIAKAKDSGRMPMLREFRKFVRKNISKKRK